MPFQTGDWKSAVKRIFQVAFRAPQAGQRKKDTDLRELVKSLIGLWKKTELRAHNTWFSPDQSNSTGRNRPDSAASIAVKITFIAR